MITVLADGVKGTVLAFVAIGYGVKAVVQIDNRLTEWDLNRLKIVEGIKDVGTNDAGTVGSSGSGAGATNTRANGSNGSTARGTKG